MTNGELFFNPDSIIKTIKVYLLDYKTQDIVSFTDPTVTFGQTVTINDTDHIKCILDRHFENVSLYNITDYQIVATSVRDPSNCDEESLVWIPACEC